MWLTAPNATGVASVASVDHDTSGSGDSGGHTAQRPHRWSLWAAYGTLRAWPPGIASPAPSASS